jgi:hypothetical protein
VLVGVNNPRLGMVLSAQGLGEKALGRCCVAFSRQKEVDDARSIGPAYQSTPSKLQDCQLKAVNRLPVHELSTVNGPSPRFKYSPTLTAKIWPESDPVYDLTAIDTGFDEGRSFFKRGAHYQ